MRIGHGSFEISAIDANHQIGAGNANKKQEQIFLKKQEPNDNSKKVVGIMKNSKKNGEVLYLIKPNRFKSLLGEAFHSKTTEDLRANGYLVTSRRRGYHYQQRVGEELKDFIAIRASILEAQSH